MVLGPDLAGACIDLAGNQKRHQGSHDLFEGNGPAHQIVFMVTIAIAFAIRIVFVNEKLPLSPHLLDPLKRPPHDPLPGLPA